MNNSTGEEDNSFEDSYIVHNDSEMGNIDPHTQEWPSMKENDENPENEDEEDCEMVHENELNSSEED